MEQVKEKQGLPDVKGRNGSVGGLRANGNWKITPRLAFVTNINDWKVQDSLANFYVITGASRGDRAQRDNNLAVRGVNYFSQQPISRQPEQSKCSVVRTLLTQICGGQGQLKHCD